MDLKQGDIIQESTSREDAYAAKVIELQQELKNAKKSERASLREAENVKAQLTNVQKRCDTFLFKWLSLRFPGPPWNFVKYFSTIDG